MTESQRRLQAALARIYLDGATREAVSCGDTSALDDFGLDADDQNRVVELVRSSRCGLELFGGLLAAKRAVAVTALMPLSLSIAGRAAWNDAWLAHNRRARAESALTAAAAAVEVANILLEMLPGPCREDSLTAEVIAYERNRLLIAAASAPSLRARPTQARVAADRVYPLVHRPFIAKRFQHDIIRAVALLRAGWQPANVSRKPLLLLFYRHWDNGAVNVARASEAVVRMLERCDGTTSVARIWATLGESAMPTQTACERVLDTLAANGVIALISSRVQGAGDGKHGR